MSMMISYIKVYHVLTASYDVHNKTLIITQILDYAYRKCIGDSKQLLNKYILFSKRPMWYIHPGEFDPFYLYEEDDIWLSPNQ